MRSSSKVLLVLLNFAAAASESSRGPQPRPPPSSLRTASSASAFGTPPSFFYAPRRATVSSSARFSAEVGIEGISSSSDTVAASTASETTTTTKESRGPYERPCRYNLSGRWIDRVELQHLEIGQNLTGVQLENKYNLLAGKTGPKVFFECGVGRVDAEGRWQMVNGMLRLGKKGTKKSVTRKRADRLGGGREVELFVSNIDLNSGRLEVRTSSEQALEEAEKKVKKISASSLTEGQELVGKVVRLEPYGAFLDVGANRLGLLHIKRVADLFGKYIQKEKGMEEVAGLERGVNIRVSVLSNEKKGKLFLDFTDDVKEDAEREKEERKRDTEREIEKSKRDRLEAREREIAKNEEVSAAEARVEAGLEDEEGDWASGDISEDDAAEWAAFAAGDEEDPYHDEDDDIEEAMGISTYK